MFSSDLYRDIATSVEVLFDRQIGVINSILEVKRRPGAPDFFCYIAEACNTQELWGRANFRVAAGAAPTREGALAKAVGEAVERYCPAFYVADDLPFSSFHDAHFECIEPSEFALYTDGQYETPGFPFERFDRHTRIRWSAMTDVVDGSVWYVPSSMVLLPYSANRMLGEAQVSQPISTGLAAHTHYWSACLGALCEVIERDAFMLTWLTGTPPRLFNHRGDARVADLMRRFTLAGRNVSLFDITTNLEIPCILAVQEGKHSLLPGLAVAAAANPDIATAAAKAIEELALTSLHMEDIIRAGEATPRPSAISSQRGHLSFWCDHKNKELAAFLFAGTDHPTPRCARHVPQDYRTAADAVLGLAMCLRKHGHRVLCKNLTTPDIAEAGMHVVRVVIPGLHPLTIGHGVRALGGTRLAAAVGASPTYGNPGDSPPHPYP